MAEFKVTSESMRQVATEVNSGSESINDILARLKSRMDELTQNGWQGGASQSSSELYVKLNTGAQQVTEALAGFSSQLNQSAQAYEDTEQNVSGAFKG